MQANSVTDGRINNNPESDTDARTRVIPAGIRFYEEVTVLRSSHVQSQDIFKVASLLVCPSYFIENTAMS